MTEQELKNLACALSAVCVFRSVMETETMAAFSAFLNPEECRQKRLALYGAFVHSLAADGYCFSDFLCRSINGDENPYVVLTAKGADIPPALSYNANAELELFSALTTLNADALCAAFRTEGYLPRFENHATDFKVAYHQRLADIGRYGYGVFASAGMFRVAGEEILPIDSADTVTRDQLFGYEAEREQVFANTRALLDGKPAANVLLYGDAGTGKSSTVKACANHFYDRGVRLIELRKDQLSALPMVLGRVADHPLKFILFIDDLSFNKNDDTFSMLKAALEGSASAKAKNVVIYATSNRRHIVKESFSDRGADDVHRNDTVQELLSLSDRFGLSVYFEKPNKALYLDIAHRLAQQLGVPVTDELDVRAEAFALARGGRSPRAAEQFVLARKAEQ